MPAGADTQRMMWSVLRFAHPIGGRHQKVALTLSFCAGSLPQGRTPLPAREGPADAGDWRAVDKHAKIAEIFRPALRASTGLRPETPQPHGLIAGTTRA